MPNFISQKLEERNLKTAYAERPAYQQNDYLSWIAQAKLEITQRKRLEQMLAELEQGGGYMKMPHPPSHKN